MRAITHIASAAALLLAIGACGRHAGDAETAGKLADVPLTTLDGQKTSLAELTKGKVVVLKFGATWCGWCTKQLAEFNKVAGEYGDKVLVLDIDVREPASKVKAHGERHNFQGTTLLDPTGEAARAYGVEGIPHTIVADADGNILFKGNYTPFAKLKAAIDKAL